MRKRTKGEPVGLREAPVGALEEAVEEALRQSGALSPTKIYLWVITKYLHNAWMVGSVTVGDVRDDVLARGYDLNATSGELLVSAATVT
jgi:hypothetical protein